jgi:hypothetical protein
MAEDAQLVRDLEAQIAAGKITFDRENFRNELLGQSNGTKVTARLQRLVLELAGVVPTSIRISSLIRSAGHHGSGRAVDVGNEEVAPSLLPLVIPDVAAWNIDEIIFDAGGGSLGERNRWNLIAASGTITTQRRYPSTGTTSISPWRRDDPRGRECA